MLSRTAAASSGGVMKVPSVRLKIALWVMAPPSGSDGVMVRMMMTVPSSLRRSPPEVT